MVSYSEMYPQCSGCPRLIEWQWSRDAMTGNLETAQITDSLEGVVKAHEAERLGSEVDEKYAEILDVLGEDDTATYLLSTARGLYEATHDALKQQAAERTKRSQAMDIATGFLVSLADQEVCMTTYECSGPLNIAFLGFKKTLCRSRIPKALAIQPPAPPVS